MKLKRKIAFFLTISMMAALFIPMVSMPATATDDDPKKYGDVPEASVAPVIGAFDKAIYEEGLKLDIGTYLGGLVVNPNQGGTMWLVWYGDDLYIYGELKHSSNGAWELPPESIHAPYEGTNVELYLNYNYGVNSVNWAQYRVSTWHAQTIESNNAFPGNPGAGFIGATAMPYLETARNLALAESMFYVEYKINLLPLIKDNKIGLNVQYQESTPTDEWGTNMVLQNTAGGFKNSVNYNYINLDGYEIPVTACSCTKCQLCGGCADEDFCGAYYCECEFMCPTGGNCVLTCTCERCPVCAGGCLETVCCEKAGCEECKPCIHAYTAFGRFAPTDELLTNPHMGVSTFMRVNGSNSSYGLTGNFMNYLNGLNLGSSLSNGNYPDTSVAYYRLYWNTIETTRGEYNWDAFDKLFEIAHSRGQTVMVRLMCYGDGNNNDIPGWFRQELRGMGIDEIWLGYERGDYYFGEGDSRNGVWWRTDANHPLYIKYFSEMVKSFAERFDGDPRLDSVDLSFSGYWGEGMGTECMEWDTIKTLCDAYLDNFQYTPLQQMSGFTKETQDYIRLRSVENGLKTGWRADSFGDLGYAGPSFTHMYHIYPQDFDYINNIIPGRPLWTDGPISFEDAYTMSYWVNARWDFEYIFNKGLEWHTSTWNAKSAAVPAGYTPIVNEYLKRIGYRFSLAGVDYFEDLKQGGAFNIRSAWSNLGVAPLYHDGYALAYRLTNGDETYVFYSDADLNDWMPSRKLVKIDTPWTAVGDIKIFDSFDLPKDIAVGGYDLQVAIVDSGRFATNEPAIKLANEFRGEDGWHTIGSINIVSVVKATPSAFVTKLSGNQNNLTITVTEELSNGTTNVITKTFKIDNNTAGTYNVGGYNVYVDTKGNDQIRECKIIN